MKPSVRNLPRRWFITSAGAASGVVLFGTGSAAPAAAMPADEVATWNGKKSANGWPVIDKGIRYPIEGSRASVTLAGGEVAVVLLHVARRFHYEVDALRVGDISGHSTNPVVKNDYESNYLSGTAIAIRPGAYPAGLTGGLFPHELIVIRDILAELDGVVSWGGDEPAVPKESHFQIALKPGHPKLKRVAAKIRGWSEEPGKGAGATDAFASTRRKAARAFEQRTSN
ncbi:hypothetical protein [Streptomyces sp. ISL-100]|uniref:hypothetical protein n=1 Tax=Streptomyces sp. ISL-100 TaxID=2819173 RepID=UPI001BE6A14F|nr:hypothetical protein [Streptomyces sp. ISL-100]MBT2396200.1 hypothetical protein [Streptomyces sp. ISL-100]